MRASVVVIIREIVCSFLSGSVKNAREIEVEKMDESLLDITGGESVADFNYLPVNHYGSPVARASSSYVSGSPQANHPSRVVSRNKILTPVPVKLF